MSILFSNEGCLDGLKNRIRSVISIKETELDTIAKYFHCRLLKKGQVLLHEGARCDLWGFVHSGLLRIYSQNRKGEEYTNWFLKEGEFFTEFVSFFLNVPTLENFVALENTELVTVDGGTLEKLINQHPVFEKFVRLIYQQTIITIKENMIYKRHLDAQGRYLRFLQTRPEIVRRVPQKYIASYIDVTESTLSRIRRKVMDKQ